VNKTLEPLAVITVDPTWKYQASLGDPVPARVKVPVRNAELLKLYVPGERTMPPRSNPVREVAPPRLAIALNAANASLRGAAALIEIILDPLKIPGGNPVVDVPVVPRSPVMIVGPVFVTAAALRTPKDAADPSVI
jgi:hypothetical protein